VAIITIGVIFGQAGSVVNHHVYGFNWTGFMAQFSAAAAFNITYAGYVSDYSRYLPRNTPRSKIIAHVFAGASTPAIWLIALGAWLAIRLSATHGLVGLQTAGNNVISHLGGITGFLSAVALAATMGMTDGGGQGHSDGVSKRLRGLWAWAVSTARKYRNRSGCRGTWRDARDGDLRRWTPVDVLPVVCKQGVRGSSPLSSTGQKRNSNGRSRSTAAKYSNGDRARRRTCVRVGLRPRGWQRSAALEIQVGAGLRAAEQEERVRHDSAQAAGRPASSVPNLPFKSLLLPAAQRVYE
jgi:hypothetical protein